MPSPDPATRAAIIRAAGEHGIDPSAALAIAERESNFDPRARSSKTIRGTYQMLGELRKKYGVGDSDDPYVQANGWGAFFKDVKRDMAGTLGRDPTDAEGYLGHHFGAKRAARMMTMDPATPVDQVFTPGEMRINPHFGKAGTVGKLNSSVLADIGERQAKFGAAPADYSEAGAPTMDAISGNNKSLLNADNSAVPDFSSFGAPAETLQPSVQQAAGAPDFSPFGVPA